MTLAIGQRVKRETSLHIWTGTVVKDLGETAFGPEVMVQLDAVGVVGGDPMQFMVSELAPILGPVHQTRPHRKREPTPEEARLAQEILRDFGGGDL